MKRDRELLKLNLTRSVRVVGYDLFSPERVVNKYRYSAGAVRIVLPEEGIAWEVRSTGGYWQLKRFHLR